MQIFTNIGNLVDEILDTIKNASLDEKFIQLQSLIGILLVLSIMYKGYQTIAGRNQDPVRDIIWDVARKMFILTFVLNINGWLDLSISALEGIYEWAGGGIQFYTQLDELTERFCKVISVFWDKRVGVVSGDIDVVFGCLIIFFVLLSYLAIVIPFAFMIINATITNTFLIIVLPLALLCFMYEMTREAFVQWFNMFVSNIFLLLFMSAFTDFIINNLSALYDFNESNPFLIIIKCIFWTAILITIVQVIKTMASQLARVSLDSAAASGMGQAMGMTGRAAGFAWKGTKRTAKAGGGFVGGSFNSDASLAAMRGGLAGLAGYGAKKAVKALFGMARSKGQ